MKYLPVLAFALVAAGPALARDCRAPDVPPGVRVQLPPGCSDPIRTPVPRRGAAERVQAENGFIDLGNGTKVKVSGRVRAEVGFRR